MPCVRDTRGCPRLQGGAVHDGRVHFNDAGSIENGALTGIEQWVVLKNPYRRFGGIQCRAAVLQNFPSGAQEIIPKIKAITDNN